MKTTNFFTFTLITLLLTAIIVTGSFKIYKYWSKSHFTCDANFVVVKDQKTLSVMISYNVSGANGVASIKGNLQIDKDIYNLSRTSHFSLKRVDDLYIAYSNLLSVLPVDNTPPSLLQDMLPHFYFLKNQELSFYLIPEGHHGFIFTNGYVPSFFCEKK